MSRDPELQAVIDKQACIEVVYRLARAVDRCDEALMRACFHDDATDDHGIFDGTAADFVDFVMPMLGGMIRTQHAVSNVLVEVNGDEARSEAYFRAQHSVPRDGGVAEVFAAGRYLDRLERRNGEWRISHRHAVFDWDSDAPSTTQWDKEPMASAIKRGERGGGDPSYAHFESLGRS